MLSFHINLRMEYLRNGLLLLLFFVAISCSRTDKKFYSSRDSNSLRKRLHIPIIEENMVISDSTDFFRSYWSTAHKYPLDSLPLHVWKVIIPGRSVLSFESDAFRKRIDDTLLFQLNIDSKLYRDSSVTITGSVFYTQTSEQKSISLEFDKKYVRLDSMGVDSVKKSWQIAF